MPDIPGANTNSYTPVTADIGANVYCRVTGTNDFGVSTVSSNVVGPVAAVAAPGAPSITTAPAIADITPTIGETLTSTDGSWTNTPTSYAHQWYEADDGAGAGAVAIAGATSASFPIVAETPGPATTNMWSWVKADAGTFTSDAMTGAVTADASPVGGWQDQSGSNHHWTQVTSGNKPVLKTNVVNTKPVIRFDHTVPQWFAGVSGAALTAGEIFIVVKALNDPSLAGGASGAMWTVGMSGIDNAYPFSDGNIYEGWGSTTRQDLGNPGPSLNVFRLYNVVSVSGEFTAFIDGIQQYTTTTNTVGFSATPKLGTSMTESFSGDIAEVIAYSAKCSAPDKARTKAYLGTKYNLEIAVLVAGV